MTFRRDETKNFPVQRTDRIVWYAILTQADINKDCWFGGMGFSSAKSSKKSLLTAILEFQKRELDFLILGIWQGQWKTDIFILNPKELIPLLEANI
jgi:hypothetical protein